MLLSCKGCAGLVVNVTTIIPQTDKAFRVSLAIKLRVLDRLLNIDGRLSWVVNCAHLTLCAAAQHFRKSCDGPCGGEEIRKTGRGLPQYSVRGWVRHHFSVITGRNSGTQAEVCSSIDFVCPRGLSPLFIKIIKFHFSRPFCWRRGRGEGAPQAQQVTASTRDGFMQ